MWDYRSELEYMGRERNLDLEKLHLASMPTEKLISEYNRMSAQLDDLRREEPPKKRGRKSDYRWWVHDSHEYQELLDFMARELIERKEKDPLGLIEYKEEWWMD